MVGAELDVVEVQAVRREHRRDGTDQPPSTSRWRGIAPLLIQCGSNEVLLDDATRLAAAAATADVAVQLDVTPGVPHVFQASAPELDEGNAALARTGAFLQAQMQLAQ